MFSTSKLITCFLDGFTLKRKSQSIAYLLNGSEHIYWILDLENEVPQYGLYGQTAFQNARVRPGSGVRLGSGGRGSSFFGVAPACCLDKCNAHWGYLGPLHTQDCEPVTITLQALSLVGKAEPVQVRFTLHLRDQHSM